MPIRPAGAPGPGDGTIAPLCGQTTFHYWSRPPTGVNPYEQFTIYGVVIRLASGTLYYFGQSFHPTSCNANATLLHEFGHRLGLGHTSYNNQVMWALLSQFWPRDRDLAGLMCMYDLTNCGQ